MRILKEKSGSYKNQNYFKYKINLPEIVIDGCKFMEGDELEAFPEPGILILKKKEPEKGE